MFYYRSFLLTCSFFFILVFLACSRFLSRLRGDEMNTLGLAESIFKL